MTVEIRITQILSTNDNTQISKQKNKNHPQFPRRIQCKRRSHTRYRYYYSFAQVMSHIQQKQYHSTPTRSSATHHIFTGQRQKARYTHRLGYYSKHIKDVYIQFESTSTKDGMEHVTESRSASAPADIARRCTIPGLTPNYITIYMPVTCSTCADGKGTQRPQTCTNHDHRLPADAIRYCCPDTPPSQLQHRHIVTFLDAETRYAIANPIRTRGDLAKIIPTTLRHIKPTQGLPPLRFDSDNAKKYRAHAIQHFQTRNGITKAIIGHISRNLALWPNVLKYRYSTQQGVLFHAQLPTTFWA